MRAVLCHSFGSIRALTVEEIPEEEVGPGDVCVDVRAAGLNFPDLLLVQGLYQLKPPLPFSPGIEIAGVVRSVGPGVTEFAPGDRVLSCTGYNGFRERIVTGPTQLVRIPDAMPFTIAGGFPTTYCTTLHALEHRAALQKGETLLVLGAAGGVGSAAIEVGKAMGARVIAAASSDEKLAFCRSLGADETINYSTDDLKIRAKELGPVDVVYDPIGGPFSEPALRSLNPGGRFLVIGFAAGSIPKIPLNLPLLKECSIVGVQWGAWARREPEQQQILTKRLLQWWEEKKLKPHVDATYHFEDVVRALEDLAERRIKGKAVILP